MDEPPKKNLPIKMHVITFLSVSLHQKSEGTRSELNNSILFYHLIFLDIHNKFNSIFSVDIIFALIRFSSEITCSSTVCFFFFFFKTYSL